jgi:hypothetical protein
MKVSDETYEYRWWKWSNQGSSGRNFMVDIQFIFCKPGLDGIFALLRLVGLPPVSFGFLQRCPNRAFVPSATLNMVRVAVKLKELLAASTLLRPLRRGACVHGKTEIGVRKRKGQSLGRGRDSNN